LLAGILVVVFLPRITSYRYSVAERLIAQSQITNDTKLQLSLLEQAHLIGGGDSRATDALAQFWLSRGEVKKAITVYETSSLPEYTKLGSLALGAQDYSLALGLYQEASKNQADADTLTGEATALYNLEKTSDGCAKALQANKQNLQSQSAKNAVAICVLLDSSQQEAVTLSGAQPLMSSREAAYLLINNQVYRIGESKLASIENKTVTDWLVLSRLAIARGDINLAISSAENGALLDRSNIELNKQLVNLYTISGDSAKSNQYSQRLQQLELVKYQ